MKKGVILAHFSTEKWKIDKSYLNFIKVSNKLDSHGKFVIKNIFKSGSVILHFESFYN